MHEADLIQTHLAAIITARGDEPECVMHAMDRTLELGRTEQARCRHVCENNI